MSKQTIVIQNQYVFINEKNNNSWLKENILALISLIITVITIVLKAFNFI